VLHCQPELAACVGTAFYDFAIFTKAKHTNYFRLKQISLKRLEKLRLATSSLIDFFQKIFHF
jgi:hypothetical protein